MINNDRIVPITVADYLSFIGMVLALGGTSYSIGKSKNVEGDVDITGTGSAGNFLCDQPVRNVDIKSGVTGATVYFVAGSNFEHVKVAGATPTYDSGSLEDDDILKDGRTLYKAVLASGELAISAVTPIAE